MQAIGNDFFQYVPFLRPALLSSAVDMCVGAQTCHTSGNHLHTTRRTSTVISRRVCLRRCPQSIVAYVTLEGRLSGEGVLFGKRECLCCVRLRHKRKFLGRGYPKRGLLGRRGSSQEFCLRVPLFAVWVTGLRIDTLRLLAGCRKRRLNQAPLNLRGLI